MYAGNRAVGSAAFLRQVFAADVFDRVFWERLGRIAALLRTVMDESFFANIQIAGAGAALPLIRLPRQSLPGTN